MGRLPMGRLMDVDQDGELRQADLTHLRLQEMTREQRAELRRRYEDFLRHFGGTGVAPTRYPEREKRVTKWVPGAKA